MIYETKPENLLNLPWNLKDEFMAKMSAVQQRGAKFVVPIPEAAVYENQAERVKKTQAVSNLGEQKTHAHRTARVE